MPRIATALVSALLCVLPAVGRTFTHPGLSYTDADIERMRHKIELRQEPYYSTFTALQSSPYSKFSSGEPSPVTAIAEGKFNGTIGNDGRKVHDLALLYRLTDDSRYADEAVKILRRYNGLTSCSARGTAPLDNGKIYLMLEGAELLRDYSGWSEADRRAFADMLVYPAYSDKTYPDDHRDKYSDENNRITFYWNICNFDTGRWGNQGLFAARGMMAMGIFLDNEKIYDRALNYIMNREARPDDIPYSSLRPRRVRENSQSAYLVDYSVAWYDSGSQFISDEALEHYIYPNGQSQEACRDQGHAMVGVGLLCDIAEMAGNQGDDVYSACDSRLLLGLEYACRYNLSPLTGEAWEPAGYTENPDEATLDNGLFIRTDSHSLRWRSIAPSPDGREKAFSCVRFLTQALFHYKGVEGLDPERYRWLEAAFGHTIGDGIENWGATNHQYEWKGWGTLTKYQSPDPETSAATQKTEVDAGRYFTLSGISMATRPSKAGIYIVRKGQETDKLIIKD